MGNIFTSFFSRRPELSPDQALQILLDTLNAQRPHSPSTDGSTPAASDGSASAEHGTAQTLTFNEWCRCLGLPRQKLDRYIRKELGSSGAEFVCTIRSQRLHL